MTLGGLPELFTVLGITAVVFVVWYFIARENERKRKLEERVRRLEESKA